MDLNQAILLHQDLGIGVKYIDDEMQIQYDTLTKEAIKKLNGMVVQKPTKTKKSGVTTTKTKRSKK